MCARTLLGTGTSRTAFRTAGDRSRGSGWSWEEEAGTEVGSRDQAEARSERNSERKRGAGLGGGRRRGHPAREQGRALPAARAPAGDSPPPNSTEQLPRRAGPSQGGVAASPHVGPKGGSRGKLVASVPGATPGGRLGPGSRVNSGCQVKRPGLSPRPLRPAPRPCPTSTAPHFCLAPRDPECRPPGGPEDQSTLCSHFPGAVPTELVGPPGWQRTVPAQGQLTELCAWQVGCPRPQ